MRIVDMCQVSEIDLTEDEPPSKRQHMDDDDGSNAIALVKCGVCE